MFEGYLRQSPLASLGLAARAAAADGAAGVTMGERERVILVNLRGDGADRGFLDRARQALGVDLPVEPNTVAEGTRHRVLWLGPNDWLVVAGEGENLAAALDAALAGMHVSVTDNSDARAVVALSGARARDVLAKGCPLDLHVRAFGPMRCAQSRLAKVAVLIDQRDDTPSYDLYVLRSQARYLWRWLEDAASEYGVSIARP
ncbi:MAG: sarcosine oxidase subunit gamma [Alphaproteobacteria bacterium]